MAAKKGMTGSKTKETSTTTGSEKVSRSEPEAKTAAPAKKSVDVQGNGSRPPTHEEIAKKAYEIWQREGGSEQENWAKAEKELLAARR